VKLIFFLFTRVKNAFLPPSDRWARAWPALGPSAENEWDAYNIRSELRLQHRPHLHRRKSGFKCAMDICTVGNCRPILHISQWQDDYLLNVL
jgi:hypothetical protein